MKIKYLAIFTALVAMPALFGCGGSANGGEHNHVHEHEEHDHAHEEPEEEHENEHAGEHGHEGEEHADGEIVFTPEKAKRFGVVTAKVEPRDFNDIIRVSGKILPAQGDEVTVIARSAGAVRLAKSAVVGTFCAQGSSIGYVSAKNIVGGDANEDARITYINAKNELERITPLYKEKIVTQKEYNAAKEAFDKAYNAYSNRGGSGAGTPAVCPISGTITQMFVTDGAYVEAGAPIATLSKNAKLLLRADLPERYAKSLQYIRTATFKPSYSDTTFDLSELRGVRTSSNVAVTSTPGYIPVCFEFANDGSVIPGTFAEVSLIGAGKPGCIVVPVGALTEEQGEYFVYVRIDDECYMKRKVSIGMSNGRETEVLSGLAAGEELVTEGAIIIKMAANTGAVPGHTHEH